MLMDSHKAYSIYLQKNIYKYSLKIKQ